MQPPHPISRLKDFIGRASLESILIGKPFKFKLLCFNELGRGVYFDDYFSYHKTVCDYHCIKSVQIRSIFWSAFSRIQPEHRKIRARKNSVFGLFSRSVFLGNYSVLIVGVMFLWKIMIRLEILGKG